MHNTELLSYSDPLKEIQAFNRQRAIANTVSARNWLKKGIWLYFWLLVFEGALRKWVLPGLATPLLLIRDPVAIWLIGYGYMQGYLKNNVYVVSVYLITAIAFVFTLITGHENLFVALYGARITLIHFPLVFLISQVFTQEDVIKMGKAFLAMAIVQTFVATVQFYSPQSAWINKAVGGVEVLGFTGAMGYSRPPGTFSFTNGFSAYYGLTAPFIFYFWFKGSEQIKKWLLIAGTIALIVAIPISISRTLFFEVGLTAAFTLIIAAQKPKLLIPIFGAALGLIVTFILLNNISFFKTSVDAFTDRFTTASAIENQGQQSVGASTVTTSLFDRFFGGIFSAIEGSSDYPFFGLGLGFGTNAGAQLLTGKMGFTIAEGEWGRVIGEMGVLLGLLFIATRSYISINILQRSFSALQKNNYLPWLLSSYTFTLFLQGQWAQPTALGFSVLGMGLNIAAFNTKQVRG
jgi:hypothetical protein